MRGDRGRVGDRKASCEAERDEKKVDGVGHSEGDDVDELKLQLDLGRLHSIDPLAGRLYSSQ